LKHLAHKTARAGRFERRREEILAAAQDILYRQGLKGMTLAEVAAKVGLNGTSITYYFRKKEDLAAACLLAGIARLDAIVDEGARAGDVEARVRAVFRGFFARHRAARLGEESQLAPLGDIRSLDEPHLSKVRAAFAAFFGKVRALFDGMEGLDHKARTAQAHLLLEQVFWSTGWLYRYDVEDYPRVLERTLDIYFRGLAPPGASCLERVVRLDAWPRDSGPDLSREDFLKAATRLINQFGYRGASVERISAELNVTKGSFYHHNEAKEDLVEACFRRTADLMQRAQFEALASKGTPWRTLERTIVTLVDFQLSEDGPLLRSSVLPTLSDPLRAKLTERFNRIVDRFAAMIADGVVDGSVRGADPMIAAQMAKVAINAAADARSWVRGLERAEAPSFYARPLLMGVFAE
jgi:AcrR family transcriptional regulator